METNSSSSVEQLEGRHQHSEPSMVSTADARNAGDVGVDVSEPHGKDGLKTEEVKGREDKVKIETDAGSSETEMNKPAEGGNVAMDIDEKNVQKSEKIVKTEEEQKAGIVVNPKKKGGRLRREKAEVEQKDEHVEMDSTAAEGMHETKTRRRRKRGELPVVPLLTDRDRPARERKSIDRFVASSLDKEKKEVVIKQGTGTPLMDIPNVAYKLGKRGKGDELLGMLHSLLFNQRGKASAHKYNIYRFSGFVWGENEEKEKSRVKEKLEKYTKEGLGQLIDVLDLHLPKTGKKEELVVKVLQFLESPHKTTDVSLGEKEQKLKEKKRKGRGPGRGRGSTPGRKRQKIEDSTPKRGRGRKRKEESESDGGRTTEASSGDEDLEVEEVEGAHLTFKESEEEDDDDDEDYQAKKKLQRKSPKSSKTETKEVQRKVSHDDESDQGPKKSSTSDFSLSVKTPSPEINRNTSKPPDKVYTKGSRKKYKDAKEKEVIEKEKEKEKMKQDFPERKKRGKDKEKSKEKNSEKTGRDGPRVRGTIKKKSTGVLPHDEGFPSDEVLQTEIRNLLKDLNRADFSKVTFMDIVLQLQDKLNVDLSVEKAHVKLLIRQEVSRLAGEASDEEAPSEADAPAEGEDEAQAVERMTPVPDSKSPASASREAAEAADRDAENHETEGSGDISGDTAAVDEEAGETNETVEATKGDQKEGLGDSPAVEERADDVATRIGVRGKVETSEGTKTEQEDVNRNTEQS
ncbi:hypothetical protein R1flu_015392 [Riccia fluitans]|uniref:DEK-C domain-containing protein n=1 Tax=Riccia fluitans TaxID=41844 RepID=A0ABD1YIT4_9MARC